ncbi:hypothetical protein Hanom_Chr04g00353581 [Helianthus anomalus]
MRYVSALREEVLIDHVNYLSMGIEDCFKEINLLQQRLNILAMPPMEPIWPQEDWNLANEVIQPTGWEDEIPEPPPLNVAFEVPINPAPLKKKSKRNPTSSFQGRSKRCSMTSN